MVAREEKTGRFQVGLNAGRMILHFERGRVIQAREALPDPGDSFLSLIRELRLLSATQWKQLSSWQREHPDRDPVAGILSKRMLDREQVQEWLEIHAQGNVDRLLEASEGTFNFEPTLTSPRFAIPLSIQPEFMIMEAGRRTDETKELLSRDLPSKGVPAIRPGYRPTAGQVVTMQLLRLIDGRRSGREILIGTTIPDYEAAMELRRLVEEKVCVVRIPGGRHERTVAAQRQSGMAGRAIVITAATIMIVCSILVGVRLWGRSLGLPIP